MAIFPQKAVSNTDYVPSSDALRKRSTRTMRTIPRPDVSGAGFVFWRQPVFLAIPVGHGKQV